MHKEKIECMIMDPETQTPLTLNSKWSLWYHHELDKWTVAGYRKIYEFSDLEGFWRFFNNINCIGGINKLHFFLMRDNITPVYEDDNNCRGGTWSSIVSLENAEESFIDLMVNTIGEKVSDTPSDITGVSVNVKSGVSVLKVWNRNRNNGKTSKLAPIKHIQGHTIYKNHPKN